MVTERRRALRYDYRDGFLPPAARVRPGHDVIIVNLSTSGMLVEGTCRLHPGCLVESRLFFERGPLQIDGEVVRAFVSTVDKSGVRYRAGIAFALAIPVTAPPDFLRGYQLPGSVAAGPPGTGSSYPESVAGIPDSRRILLGRASSAGHTVALDLDQGNALHPGDTGRW
jgi:hypothetical protein